MEIGARRIMRRERSVAYEVTVFGNFSHIFAAYKIGFGLCSRFYRPNFFCVSVIHAAIGNVEAHITIDPHVAPQFHIVRAGIVLCVVGVNVCVARMNRNIIARRCQPVFICSFPSGRNFNRNILWSLDFSSHKTGARKESDEQQNRLSHGGRRKYCSKGFLKSPKALCAEIPSAGHLTN